MAEAPRRQWSIEEIEAWGRSDALALQDMERGLTPTQVMAAQPRTEHPMGGSDDSWQDEWKRDVAAKQAAAFAELKGKS